MDLHRCSEVLAAARAQGRNVLLETEGFALLEAAGLEAPRRLLFTSREVAARELDARSFPGEKVVVKIASASILHKSDVGGVKIVSRDRDAILATVGELERAFRGQDVQGFVVEEFVPHGAGLGAELLLGARWTPDFGPIVTVGAGGVTTELLARNLKPGSELAIFGAHERLEPERLRDALGRLAIAPLLFDGFRGAPPLTTPDELARLLARVADLARELMPAQLLELEVNPVARSGNRWVALDVLARLGDGKLPEPPLPRPVEKLQNLLAPRSIAIAGVSEKHQNPGRIILGNILREGFDPERVQIVKAGADWIDGCRCVPDIASLRERVDLLILSIAAEQVPSAVTEAVEKRKAESVIVIPGGLEEKRGSEALVARMRSELDRARKSDWKGPLLNGGNCLGIRSRPGRYDTLFIPSHKLPPQSAHGSPLAVLSQSGAFAISCINRLPTLDPKYLVTLGNQSDLTLGDYLEHLADDRELRVFAVYVEGFKPGDGEKFLRAVRKITSDGRNVILYRAGRTAAGAAASASHTASIAGEYAVTRALAQRAGAVVAESLADFEELVKLFTLLDGRRPKGLGVGAISNAGFECVATADNLGPLALAPFTARTRQALLAVLRAGGIDQLVDVHDPLDVTPMCGDAAFEAAARAVIDDEGVDLAVLGCVPLTPALQTLPAASSHREDVRAPDALAARLATLFKATKKPVVATVAAGALYDPLAALLESNGLPVFRTIDRALRLLGVFAARTVEPRAR